MNEQNDRKQTSPISEVLENANLPQLLLGDAGKALSRLVGEVADIPSAWIKRHTQRVTDGTEARSIVSKAIAEAAAKAASSDSDIVSRATEAFIGNELRKQINREAIAGKTVEYLAIPHAQERSGEIDDDWLNVFARYAEDATSERLRDLWARILAGEIRKPQTFSLRTLRFISELDQATARSFEAHLPRLLVDDLLLRDEHLHSDRFTALLKLQEAELVVGVGGDIAKQFLFEAPYDGLRIKHWQNRIVLGAPPGTDYRLNAILLTSIGIQMAGIIALTPTLEDTKKIAERLPRQGLSSISVFAPDGKELLVWKKEEESK